MRRYLLLLLPCFFMACQYNYTYTIAGPKLDAGGDSLLARESAAFGCPDGVMLSGTNENGNTIARISFENCKGITLDMAQVQQISGRVHQLFDSHCQNKSAFHQLDVFFEKSSGSFSSNRTVSFNY